MQKHAEDPAAVPSQPTLGEPRAGMDQEIPQEKSHKKPLGGGKTKSKGASGRARGAGKR